MKIQVTQEDIDRGHRGLEFSCPVAGAITRAVKGLYACSVTNDRILLFHTPNFTIKTWIPNVPNSVKNFTEAFDVAVTLEQLKALQPFEFELDYEENNE